MSIFKRVMCMLLVFACAFSFAACENKDSIPVSIEKVKSAIFESQFPEMVELGKNQLSNYYNCDEELFSEFSVYIADSESRCDEVAIFRLAAEDSLKAVVAAIEKRVSSQLSITNTQNSAEFMKLSERVLLRKGDMLVLVVSDQGEDIAERLKHKFGFKDIKI